MIILKNLKAERESRRSSIEVYKFDLFPIALFRFYLLFARDVYGSKMSFCLLIIDYVYVCLWVRVQIVNVA